MLIYDALLFKSETHFVPHRESVQCTCFYMVLTSSPPPPPTSWEVYSQVLAPRLKASIIKLGLSILSASAITLQCKCK